jgi:LmbE family N-acetylglucosaminyl deacetylase
MDELVALRRAEATVAGSRLGLPADAYVFLDFPDHQLDASRDAATSRVGKLLTAFNPEQVFVPHRHDGLQDHEETWAIVMAAISASGRAVDVFEYPVWLWNTWPWTVGSPRSGTGIGAAARTIARVLRLVFGCRVHFAPGTMRSRKLEALDAYRSQLERRGGDPKWPILGDVSEGDFLERFKGEWEVFRHLRVGKGTL